MGERVSQVSVMTATSIWWRERSDCSCSCLLVACMLLALSSERVKFGENDCGVDDREQRS